MVTYCTSFPPVNPITSFKHHKPNSPTPLSSQPNHTTTSLATQSNILLSSYLKTKTTTQALQLFHLLPIKDTITYNTIISACSNQHDFSTSLDLFFQLINSANGLHPDTLTFRSILKVCVETDNYPLGVQVHGYLTKLYGSCNVDLITSTHLINLYAEVGMIEFACNVFDEIPLGDLDVVAFSSMMGCYNKSGLYSDAVKMLITLMENDDLRPNEFVFTCALSAAASLFSLSVGRQIHGHIVKGSLRSDVFIGTSLINMYVKCNHSSCGKKAFLEILTPNVVAWNAILSGEFDGKEVLKLFVRMWGDPEWSVSPDHMTFAAVLRACKDVDLFFASQLHGLMVKTIGPEVDVFIGGALFDIYVDSGCTLNAQRVFEYIRGKDITAFNLAIRWYRRNGLKEEAIRLFHEALQIKMNLSEDTLTSLLTTIDDLNEGKQLHALATKLGFSGSRDNDASIATSLVIMYSKFHCLENAIRLFKQILFPDLVLWTSMISSFSTNGESRQALEWYVLMLSKGLDESPNHYTYSSVLQSCASLAAVEEGKQIHAQIMKSNPAITSDLFVMSGLVDMYAKSGYIKEAQYMFDTMPERDLAAWNSMISGLAQHGYAETAIEVFHELLNETNLEPNHITYVGVLSACSHRGLVEDGYRYFRMINNPSIDHYTCLMDLLGRAGHLEEALNLIEEMPFDTNEVIWSSLLSSSVLHDNIIVGEYSANKLFELNPKDEGTYVALSNIYAAAGRWEDVNKIRKLMKDLGVKKNPGRSWLTIKGKVHVFLADDKHQMQDK